jgi:hypothetical protein
MTLIGNNEGRSFGQFCAHPDGETEKLREMAISISDQILQRDQKSCATAGDQIRTLDGLIRIRDGGPSTT